MSKSAVVIGGSDAGLRAAEFRADLQTAGMIE